jgi:hypothetical protein
MSLSKLTLSIDEKVIRLAKKYAQKHKRSLSDIVEHYLMQISSKEDEEEFIITPNVKRLAGIIKAPADFDYKKERGEWLKKKYSR